MSYKKSNTNGQATMANSEPIVLASDQSPVTVTGPLTDVQIRATALPVSGSVAISTNAEIGTVTETAPATDIASSGLNGRLQRVAQRITSLITALGSPFQAGASIANTAFIANAGTNLNTSALNLEATQALIKAKTDNIPPLGQALAAASIPVVLTAAQIATLTPQINALTDGQLRATPVPVSGTVTANLGTVAGLALDSTVAKDGTDITTPSPAMPAGGVGIRGWLSAIWTKLNASLAVTGTFWQATQPVSLATNTPDVTDRAARLLGVVASVTTITNALPTGTNTIGAVNIAAAQTLATVTAVTAITNALPVGANVIGKTSIDQTTPGTTNLVALTAETTKVIGTVNVSQKQTYQASTIIPLVAAVTINVPFFNIIGSATKTVTVKRIVVSGMTLTAVGYFTINVEKLSTASSAGTSTTLVATALDTNNAAVTAVVKAYTAAPTKGTLVGTLRSWRALWQATTTAAAGITDYYHFDFGDVSGSGGVVLRGVAQELALTFPVVLASAGTLSISVEWTEE